MLHWLLPALGHAQDASPIPYAGISTVEIAEFGALYYQSHDQGWYTHVSNGLVFVYVAPTEELAITWYDHQLETHKWRKPKALSGLGDSAAAVEDQLVVARFHNLGILSWCDKKAVDWIQFTESQALKGTPTFPEAPQITEVDNGRYRVQYTGVQMQYIGGKIDPQHPDLFLVPPNRLIIWDELGRSTEQYFSGTHPVPPPETPETTPESKR